MVEDQAVNVHDTSTYVSISLLIDWQKVTYQSVIVRPTDMLIADFYTKPLQGKLFRIFRNLILNLNDKDSLNISRTEQLLKKEMPTPTTSRSKSSQECVGGKSCSNKSTLPYTYRDA